MTPLLRCDLARPPTAHTLHDGSAPLRLARGHVLLDQSQTVQACNEVAASLREHVRLRLRGDGREGQRWSRGLGN